MKTYRLSWKNHCLELGPKTCVMGILNITPDSFSDGGEFFSLTSALARGEKLASDGADIIDIGGESTRPFSEPVSAREEMRRVLPVIEKLAARVSVPISIDTTKAEVARAAIQAGAAIINDISSLAYDPLMAGVAAEYGVPLILMHIKGTPKTMQIEPVYDDLIGEIRQFFENAIVAAEKSGVSRSKIIIDPGIGFGKTLEHNLSLIRQLHEFAALDLPILAGPSRKAFIRKILKACPRLHIGNPEEKDINPQLPQVETGTQAAVAAAVLNGAHIVRVHNVAETRCTVEIIDAVKNSPDFK